MARGAVRVLGLSVSGKAKRQTASETLGGMKLVKKYVAKVREVVVCAAVHNRC